MEYETIRLIGGQRSGELVKVRKGLPWIRMPQHVPMPLRLPTGIPPGSVNIATDLYERRTWTWPNGRRSDFFVLKGMLDDEAAIEVDKYRWLSI